MKKYLKKYFSNKNSNRLAFALPTLIVISTTLMIISAAVLQGTLSVKTSLDNQYYDQLAKEAAEAGVAYANACIASGADISNNAGPLRANTDCEGVSQRPNGYVVNDNGVRSSFLVEGLDVRADGSVVIESEGYVERLRRNGGIFKTHQSTIKQATGVIGSRLKANKVVASARTSFVIASDGSVYGSGHNTRGQLGLGDTTSRMVPTKVPIKDAANKELKILDVVAGDFTTYFLASDYNVYAVGDNFAGQLGIGTKVHQHSPVKVNLRDPANNPITARSITSDGYSLYIIGSDNYVYSVGGNTYGELGIGTTTDQTLPVRMNLKNPSNVLLTAKSVVMNDWSVYVIASDDYVYAMGNNANGQLGIGTTGTSQATPVRVNIRNPSNVAITTREVYASGLNRHVFFLGSDNFVYSVGSNYNGELGTGSSSWLTTPQRMQLKDTAGNNITATSVTVAESTYIVGSDGYLYATGANASGQLGNGTTTSSLVPVRVQLKNSSGAFLKPLSVKAHKNAAMVTASDGSVYAFGENIWGGLGTGDANRRTLPTRITPAGASGNNKVRDIFIWDQAMFYINTDNVLYAAGYNFSGKLGVGNDTDQFTPQPVLLPIRSATDSIAKGVNSIYASFVIATDGSVYAAGSNSHGTLGLGNNTSTNIVKKVPLKDASGNNLNARDIIVHALGLSTHFLASDNNLYATGRNDAGQLGLGDTVSRNIPTKVTIKDPSNNDVVPVNVTSGGWVDTGTSSVFVLGSDGYAYATGRNDFGQLGIGSTTNQTNFIRVDLRDPSNNPLTVRKIFTNSWSTYFIASDNFVYAVGRNNYGQLGIGNTINQSTPVRMNVRNASSVALTALTVSADKYSALVIASDGQIYGSGLNGGALGTGVATTVSTPTLMVLRDPSSATLTARSVVTNGNTTFVIASDNYAYATGYNTYGQLGIGSTTQIYTPVRVNLRNSSNIPLTTRDVGSYGAAISSYFLASDNYAYAAGYNVNGELGLGTDVVHDTTNRSTPARMNITDGGGSPVTIRSITSDHRMVMAIGGDGFLHVNGYNAAGNLGQGHTTNLSYPALFKIPLTVTPGNRVIL